MAQRVDLPPSLTTQVWSPKPTWGTERTNSSEFLLTTTRVHWHMPPPPHTRKSRFLKCIAYNVIYTTVTQKRKEVDHCIGTRLPDLPGLLVSSRLDSLRTTTDMTTQVINAYLMSGKGLVSQMYKEPNSAAAKPALKLAKYLDTSPKMTHGWPEAYWWWSASLIGKWQSHSGGGHLEHTRVADVT